MFRLVNSLFSPGGARGRLAILIFHRVLPRHDPLLSSEPDAARFDAHMQDMRRWFNVLPLEEAVARLAAGDLPPRALSITFDDGYADNHDVALPILRRLGLHATFFVATGFLDGGCMWNDRVIDALRRARRPVLDLRELGLGVVPVATPSERRAAIDPLLAALKYRQPHERVVAAERIGDIAGVAPPVDLMMTRAQVRALADAGMGVGAHTRQHPILAQLDPTAARAEIATGKDDLEAIIGRPVRLFAYPNGKPGRDYTAEHVAHVKQLGFVAACSTAIGVAASGGDAFQLPRFTPWDRERWKFGARLSRNLRQDRYELA